MRRSVAVFACAAVLSNACAGFAAPGAGAATNDAVTELEPVIVAAPGDPFGGLAGAGSAGAWLDTLPGVRLRSQGLRGGQNDLSIRGSSVSGAGLSIAGLSLRQPQTEHFHAELPFSPRILAGVEVLTGLEQAERTDGHLVGSVAAGLSPGRRRTFVTAGAGEDGLHWQEFLLEAPLSGRGADNRFGAGAFGGREVADAVDYPDNELDRLYGGGRVQFLTERSQTDVVFGRQRKTFGARGYYGVRPDWFAEEEIDDALLLATTRLRGAGGDEDVRLSAAQRVLEDEYRLYWSLPGVFENRHRTVTRQLFADGRTPSRRGFDAAWRVGGVWEELRSSNLGNQSRRRGVVSLLPSWRRGRTRLTAGARTEVFSGDEPAVLPQAGWSYDIRGDGRLFASYTESVRQPSFTELNYESPGSLGNAGLRRQRTRGGELGLECRVGERLRIQADVFVRRSENTVDWVRAAPTSTVWVATDIGVVDTWGREIFVRWRAHASLVVTLGYQQLEKREDAAVYAGRYVLDYPENLGRLRLEWRPLERAGFVFDQAVRLQTDNPLRTSGDEAYDGRAAVRLRPLQHRSLALTVAVDNVWNEDFQTLPGQPPPGRRASAAVEWGW